jgi:hypothetical protein
MLKLRLFLVIFLLFGVSNLTAQWQKTSNISGEKQRLIQ